MFALERAIGRRHVARHRQHQREGVLGGREQVRGRRVDDQDTQLGRSRDVDVVHADTGAAHDLQATTGAQERRIDLGTAAHDQGIELWQKLG